MKQAIRKIFPILLFLTGCGCFLYPVISNELAKRNHATIIENYDDTIEDTSKAKIEKYREDAQWYNQELVKNVVYSDPFDAEALKAQNENYDDLLNLNEDGVMGYLDIPVISCYLPIYHSTEQEILKKGVGHLINSSLPIGGKATHSVLSAHSGIASSKLFTDLNLVKEKDIFYIHVLDQTLTYEVDQIKVVKPEEISDLTIDENEDYVTLVTCTPYGINSHRLLVRGKRIENEEAPAVTEVEEAQEEETRLDTNWLKATGIGIAIIFLGLFLFFLAKGIRQAIVSTPKKADTVKPLVQHTQRKEQIAVTAVLEPQEKPDEDLDMEDEDIEEELDIRFGLKVIGIIIAVILGGVFIIILILRKRKKWKKGTKKKKKKNGKRS